MVGVWQNWMLALLIVASRHTEGEVTATARLVCIRSAVPVLIGAVFLAVVGEGHLV